MSQFNDTQPIFLQISERIAEMILSKTAKEGEPLPPSARFPPISR